MAGVKGKSGGARPNTGGKRPGAGRKAAAPVPTAEPTDMLEWLKSVALGRIEASPTQVKAAIAAVAYEHQKPTTLGKRATRDKVAKDLTAGKFAPASGPRLVVDNSRA